MAESKNTRGAKRDSRTGAKKSYRFLISSALRRVWSLYSPTRKEALEIAKMELTLINKDGSISKRKKFMYLCQGCGKFFDKKEVQVDHIEPVGSVPDWPGNPGDWEKYIKAVNCEVENLQILCKPCHNKKSAEENAQRRSR